METYSIAKLKENQQMGHLYGDKENFVEWSANDYSLFSYERERERCIFHFRLHCTALWCHRAAAFSAALQFDGSFATIDCH